MTKTPFSSRYTMHVSVFGVQKRAQKPAQKVQNKTQHRPIRRPKNTRPAGCGLLAGPRSGGPPAAGPAMGPEGVLTRAFLHSGPGGPGTARSLPGETRVFFCPLANGWTSPEADLFFCNISILQNFRFHAVADWFGIPGPGPVPYVPPVGSVGG